jgi:hypothetical protein
MEIIICNDDDASIWGVIIEMNRLLNGSHKQIFFIPNSDSVSDIALWNWYFRCSIYFLKVQKTLYPKLQAQG